MCVKGLIRAYCDRCSGNHLASTIGRSVPTIEVITPIRRGGKIAIGSSLVHRLRRRRHRATSCVKCHCIWVVRNPLRYGSDVGIILPSCRLSACSPIGSGYSMPVGIPYLLACCSEPPCEDIVRTRWRQPRNGPIPVCAIHGWRTAVGVNDLVRRRAVAERATVRREGECVGLRLPLRIKQSARRYRDTTCNLHPIREMTRFTINTMIFSRVVVPILERISSSRGFWNCRI